MTTYTVTVDDLRLLGLALDSREKDRKASLDPAFRRYNVTDLKEGIRDETGRIVSFNTLWKWRKKSELKQGEDGRYSYQDLIYLCKLSRHLRKSRQHTIKKFRQEHLAKMEGA